MIALIFAHRLEAQAFLDAYPWKAKGENVYQYQDLLLGFSGEGLMEASYFIQKLLLENKEISEVINYGLAGALSHHLNYQEIYAIRSVYKQKTLHDMEFKSFTLDEKAKVDLVSAIDRIDKKEDRDYLSQFAQVVDRELWAYAFVCQKERIPLKSYKIVSDFSDKKECSQIKEKAEEFSLKMLQHFQSLEFNKNPDQEELLLPKDFYFTESLKQDFKKRSSALSKKWQKTNGQVLEMLPIEEILKLDIAAKKKTKVLLDEMEKALDPDFFYYKKRTQDFLEDMKKNGLYLSLGKYFEPTEAEIRFRFQNLEELEEKLESIKSMDLNKIYQGNP